jgi:16S rRNA (adenine1518-N6/adenine1519-N6)-dimethyltransferase
LGILKPGSFYPVPEVDSSIVRMAPREEREGTVDRGILSALARMLFTSRRKTIRNNIPAGGLSPRWPRELILDAMGSEGIDPGRRAEELSPEDYIRLAVRFARLK